MVLTSSRTAKDPNVDIFSDYDIEFYVKDMRQFLTDDWLSFFGDILIRWPLEPIIENNNNVTRLVLFNNEVRIDFQITDNVKIDGARYDNGFKVLLDKDGIAKDIKLATYSQFVVKKPTEKEFIELINDFFWDGTYVAKNLWRDELYYAKYMMDSVIRFEYLQKVIEWYIGVDHDWSVNTNKYGRFFKRYLDEALWKELESTFSGASIEENWNAFFNMVTLFSKLAKEIAAKLNYNYPLDIETKAVKYYKKVRGLEGK